MRRFASDAGRSGRRCSIGYDWAQAVRGPFPHYTKSLIDRPPAEPVQPPTSLDQSVDVFGMFMSCDITDARFN